MGKTIDTPVVFMFFNRHDTTLQVFERIRAARPKRLVLVSDGPRSDREGETERVAALRRKVEKLIDWDVDVDRDYAVSNMGCGRRLSSGITSVLGRFDKAIFIEDDCVPSDSFFGYAETMLNRYEREKDVLSVSGTYFLKRKKMPCDCGFTHFPQIWGWAAWARSWEGYDLELKGWTDGFLHDIARSGHIKGFRLDTWLRCFEKIVNNCYNTWDVQFWLLCLKKQGINVFPYHNQITNIGYCPDATHTSCWWFSDKPRYEFASELRLPVDKTVDGQYERYLQQEFYGDGLTVRNFANCACLSFQIRAKRMMASWAARNATR